MYEIKSHSVRDIVNEYLGHRATGQHLRYLRRLVVLRQSDRSTVKYMFSCDSAYFWRSSNFTVVKSKAFFF